MAASTEETPLLGLRSRFELPSDASVFSEDSSSSSDDCSSDSSSSTSSSSDRTPTWRETARHLMPFILPDSRAHWAIAICALLGIVLGRVLSLASPLAFKWAIDIISDNTAVPAEKARAPFLALFADLALAIMSSAVSNIVSLATTIIRTESQQRFSSHIYDHLMTLDLEWHGSNHIGAVTGAMSRGKVTTSSLLSLIMFNLGPSITETIMVVGIFFQLGVPWAAVTTFASVALYLAALYFISLREIKIQRRLYRAKDGVSRKQYETLHQYETVATFGRNRSEVRSYAAMLQALLQRSLNVIGFSMAADFGLYLIQATGTTAGLIIAAYATVATEGPRMSPGSFVIVQVYIAKLFGGISHLGQMVNQFASVFTNAESTVKILMKEPKVLDCDSAVNWRWESAFSTEEEDAKVACGSVEFDNVTFQYPARESEKAQDRSWFYGKSKTGKKKTKKKNNKKGFEKDAKEGERETGARKEESAEAAKKVSKSSVEAISTPSDVVHGKEPASEDPSAGKENASDGIRGLSFKVPAGSTVALVGSSGSGKSTIMRLLLRLYEADSGKILLDGLDVKTISLESLRRNIGTVSQDTVLFNSSLRRNVLYGVPGATDAEVWNSVRAAALGDFVSGLDAGLETKVGARGIKISGGERQRVGVARALIKRPCILLLDEATSALDSETERKVQESINRLCAGRTSLVIAHRLSTIMHADEICVMAKGQIKERGRHADLLQIPDGIYRKMWQIQTEGIRPSNAKKVD